MAQKQSCIVNCNRDCMASKAQNIYHLAFYRNILPTCHLYIIMFNSHHNALWSKWYIVPFYRWTNKGLEAWKSFPEASQPVKEAELILIPRLACQRGQHPGSLYYTSLMEIEVASKKQKHLCVSSRTQSENRSLFCKKGTDTHIHGAPTTCQHSLGAFCCSSWFLPIPFAHFCIYLQQWLPPTSNSSMSLP